MYILTQRKINIIEKASELFAENGFDATSVQDITDACGISKGAFYLSFKSKESLLFSIFEYFFEKLIERMSGIYELQVTPRERFELFFSIQFEEIARYSDFILMQMREQVNPVNEDMMELMNNMRQKTYSMEENLLSDLYGDKISKHFPDLHVLLSGITKGYIEIIVFNKDLLDYNGLAHYIVERTDSIVEGLTEPFLKEEQLVGYSKASDGVIVPVEELLKDIEFIKGNLTDENIIVSLEVIEQELSSGEVRKPVISGMMSNLKSSVQLDALVKKLTQLIAGAK